MVVTRPLSFAGIAFPSRLGLAYVSLFSMLIGFVFWYRGLARGGIAGVGHMIAVTVAVVLCVAGARRFAR